MKALLLINEKSGAVLDRGCDVIIDAARSAADKAGDIELDIFQGGFDELVEKVRSAQDAKIVMCAGGDGTQAAIASMLLNTDRALLPLPCGTMNLFCRDLSIPLKLPEALEAGLSAPRKKVDVGRVGDRVFVNNIVFGAYAALAEAREDLREAESADDVSFGIVSAAHALMNAKPIRFRLMIDDEKLKHATNTIVVSNNAITGAEALVPSRERLDSGLLYVYLSDANNGAEFMALLSDFARGDAEASERITMKECDSCGIASSAEIFGYTIDGDPVEASEPVEMQIAPGALTVLSPAAG